mgnify:CR=1 FL=1
MGQINPKAPEILGCVYVVPLTQIEYQGHYGMSRDDEAESIAMEMAMVNSHEDWVELYKKLIFYKKFQLQTIQSLLQCNTLKLRHYFQLSSEHHRSSVDTLSHLVQMLKYKIQLNIL